MTTRGRQLGAQLHGLARTLLLSGIIHQRGRVTAYNEGAMRGALVVASIAMLAGCTEPAHTQDPIFGRASSIDVGRGSGKITLTDLNRDGRLDLVTQYLLDSVASVLLGDGTGRFVTAGSSPKKLPYQPGGMIVADLNNDHVPDLVIAHKNTSGEFVDVFLGDGAGGFGSSLGSIRASKAMEFYKPNLQLADINEDGRMDVVTANGRRPTVEVLLGKGDGSFTAGPVLSIGNGRGLSSFAIGDVDGDGHLDIIGANSEGSDLGNLGAARVITKRGDGKGNFTDAGPASDAPAGAIIETLVDANGDKRLDLVITHSNRNALAILVNNGQGAFASSPVWSTDLSAQAYAVVATDVNEDKRDDLVAATVQSRISPYNSYVTVLLARAGGFVQAAGSPFPAGRGGYNLAVADLNGDGRLDVVVSSFESSKVSLLLGNR